MACQKIVVFCRIELGLLYTRLSRFVLDELGKHKLILENVPDVMEAQPDAGHPFQQLHGPYKDPYLVTEFGEKLGLGSRRYEIIDVMAQPVGEGMAPISAAGM